MAQLRSTPLFGSAPSGNAIVASAGGIAAEALADGQAGKRNLCCSARSGRAGMRRPAALVDFARGDRLQSDLEWLAFRALLSAPDRTIAIMNADGVHVKFVLAAEAASIASMIAAGMGSLVEERGFKFSWGCAERSLLRRCECLLGISSPLRPGSSDPSEESEEKEGQGSRNGERAEAAQAVGKKKNM